MGEKTKKKGSISYAKWGYIFIAPFFIIFAVFQLIPLASTIYYSFFEYYRSGLKIIGPSFVGLKNYITLFATDLPKYFSNTLILWIIGFIPQIAISLLLAAWFTDLRLKLKGQTFFKTVIYMPNLIMASAFAMLFFALFSDNGPVNAVLLSMGWIDAPISFLNTVWGNRGLIGLMNFLMWFGNTTIMLMAAIMGVDPTLYEAAELDGCTPNQMFWKITIPVVKPFILLIAVYTVVDIALSSLSPFTKVIQDGMFAPSKGFGFSSAASWLSDTFGKTEVSFLRNGALGTTSAGHTDYLPEEGSGGEEGVEDDGSDDTEGAEEGASADSSEGDGVVLAEDAEGGQTLVEADKTVASIGTNITVRNKAGWIDGQDDDAVCDSGIVTINGRDYLMVIMTNAPDSAAGEQAFAHLARTLLEIRGDLV